MALLVELAALVGCGDESGPGAAPAAAGGPTPTTDASIAAGGVGGNVAGASVADASIADASGHDGASSDSTGHPEVDCTLYQQLQGCSLRVMPGASTATSGLSWDEAVDLQTALDLTLCGCEVWLAEGTYLPTSVLDASDPRTGSFWLRPGARVLGGFAGSETMAQERDPRQRVAILSGDLGEPTMREDNAYHVVVGADGAELDGLTIRDGQADGFNEGELFGGGLYNVGASMTLRQVSVTDNFAVTGAGIFNDAASSPRLYDCYLARNLADTGGGLYVGGASNSHVEASLFEENVAIFVGGGIAHGAGILELTGSRFVGNRGDAGGAITLSGGTAKIDRCWLEANWAGLFGGGVMVRNGASASIASSVLFGNTSVGHGGNFMVWTATLQLSAVSVIGGSAAFGGGMLIKDQSQVTINDGLWWANYDDDREIFRLEGTGNVLTIDNSLVQTAAPGTVDAAANFDADPLLINVPVLTRFTERKGTPSELRLAHSSAFTVGDRIELGDDDVERTVTAVNAQFVTFAPPLPSDTARFLRVDLWSNAAPSLDLDLHLDPASPALDRASAAAPEHDVYGQPRVDIPGVGSDCGDAGCSAADLGGIETVP